MRYIQSLNGKKFIIKLDGAQRRIGDITRVSISEDRRKLTVEVDLTDEQVAGMLGAAAVPTKAVEELL